HVAGQRLAQLLGDLASIGGGRERDQPEIDRIPAAVGDAKEIRLVHQRDADAEKPSAEMIAPTGHHAAVVDIDRAPRRQWPEDRTRRVVDEERIRLRQYVLPLLDIGDRE